MAFYILEDEIDDLRASIAMYKDIIEYKRSRGCDVSDLLDDITELEKDIVVLTAKRDTLTY